MAQTAVAGAILGINRDVGTPNKYSVTFIKQAEVAFIPEGGYGQVGTVAVPAAKQGSGAPAASEPKIIDTVEKYELDKIYCRVFMADDYSTNKDESNPNGIRGRRIGLLVVVAGGVLKIGPFFGCLNLENATTLEAKVTTPIFEGEIKVIFTNEVTKNRRRTTDLQVKAKFDGRVSGDTKVDTKITLNSTLFS